MTDGSPDSCRCAVITSYTMSARTLHLIVLFLKTVKWQHINSLNNIAAPLLLNCAADSNLVIMLILLFQMHSQALNKNVCHFIISMDTMFYLKINKLELNRKEVETFYKGLHITCLLSLNDFVDLLGHAKTFDHENFILFNLSLLFFWENEKYFSFRGVKSFRH